ncbi:MAG: aldose 1-epimerase family protein [Microbacterium sp.]
MVPETPAREPLTLPEPRSWTIRGGGYEASVASVGASLRALTYVDESGVRDLVVPFAADEVRPAFRGATLAPWPNRIVDGRYVFGGVEHQSALTEPERGHALHGLVAWLDFDVVDAASDRVTLAATIVPQTGYPWRVRIDSAYRVDADGLTQTVTAINESPDAAPYGTGPHPYLVAGPGALDEWVLELPAAQVLEVTPDRLAPVGLRSVEVDAPRFDFRVPRPLGTVEIDHAFTGLHRDAHGVATARLTDPSGTGVAMTWDRACPWVQIHTADMPAAPGAPGHRAGLAVEPMTCAPDAFNAPRYDHDAGLLVLAPGARAAASWRIAAL